MTRLLRAVHDRRNDFQGSGQPGRASTALRALLVALTRVTTTVDGFAGAGEAPSSGCDPPGPSWRLVIDDAAAGHRWPTRCARLLDAAQAVRDQLSADTWLVVGALDREIVELRGPAPSSPRPTFQAVLQRRDARPAGARTAWPPRAWCATPAGSSWTPGGASSGRCSCSRCCAPRSPRRAARRPTASCSSRCSSRRRASSPTAGATARRPSCETVLDLLLLDADNPRSLAYQLDRLTEDFGALPGPRAGAPARGAAAAARGLDDAAAGRHRGARAPRTQSAARPALYEFLGELLDRLLRAADAVERGHFVHLRPQARSSARPTPACRGPRSRVALGHRLGEPRAAAAP